MIASPLELIQIASAMIAALLTARIIADLTVRIRWLRRNGINGQRVNFSIARRSDKIVMLLALTILAAVGLVGMVLSPHDHAAWMSHHGRLHLWGDTAVAVVLAWKTIHETRAIRGNDAVPWDGVERRRPDRRNRSDDRGSAEP